MSAYFYETFTPFVKYIWTLFENTFTSYSDRVKHHVRGQTNTRIFSYLKTFFWHEHVAFQRSVFGQLTAGILFIFSPVFSPRSPPPLFSPPSQPFIIERVLKKLIYQKLAGVPKNIGVGTFPDPFGHFGAPWWPFWILQAVRQCRL